MGTIRAIAAVNPKAGSVPEDGPERMAVALEAAGATDAVVVALDAADCDAQLAEIAARRPDVLVVWGGDGTGRSALIASAEHDVDVLLLPGGTMNVLPRALHGDAPWDAILADVLRNPTRRTLPAGRASEALFFCALLAGAPAVLAEAREGVRRGALGEVVEGAREAAAALGSLRLSVRVDPDGAHALDFSPTSAVAVMVGPMARSAPMEVAALDPPTLEGAAQLIWSSLVTDWRDAPAVQTAKAGHLTIESQSGEAIPLLLDGEPVEGGPDVRIALVEAAAHCLVAS